MGGQWNDLMSDADKPNGNGGAAPPRNQLVLKLRLDPWHLEIGGVIDSDAVALAMLRQALDVYEARHRFAMAQEMAANLRQAAADAEVLKRLNLKG